MSRCWCKCEAGLGQCGPKIPRLKSLFSAHKHTDDASLRRGDRQAELQIIWEALEESVRRRTALEESVINSERRLGDILGPDSPKALAPSNLPLQTRLDMNMASLHDLDNARLGNYGWVGGLVVMVELRRRVMLLRETLNLPPCDPSADLDKVLASTMDALNNLYPGKCSSFPSSEIPGGGQKPILQRLQRFYQALRAIESSWVDTFAMKDDSSGEPFNDLMERAAHSRLQNIEEKRNARKRTRDAPRQMQDDLTGTAAPPANSAMKSQCSKNKITKPGCPAPEDVFTLEQLSQNIITKLDALNQHLKSSFEISPEPTSSAPVAHQNMFRDVPNRPSRPVAPPGKATVVSIHSRSTSQPPVVSKSMGIPTSASNQAGHNLLSKRTPANWCQASSALESEFCQSVGGLVAPNNVGRQSIPQGCASLVSPEMEQPGVLNCPSQKFQSKGSSPRSSSTSTSPHLYSSIALSEIEPKKPAAVTTNTKTFVNRGTPPSRSQSSLANEPSQSATRRSGQSFVNKEATPPRRCTPSPPNPAQRSQSKLSPTVAQYADSTRSHLFPSSANSVGLDRENPCAGQMKQVETSSACNSLSSAPKVPPPVPSGMPLRTITNSSGPAAAGAPRKPGPPPPPPPPPPLPLAGGGMALLKKQNKLKRSTKISRLYRNLKTLIEGAANVHSTSGPGSSNRRLSTNGTREGMAEALAEITKKSSYFQKIEDDVQQYARSIEEARLAVDTFETADMEQLMGFHQRLETLLENLTDETQVLARFKGFPSSKLETMRLAAALYSRLLSMAQDLERWQVISPASEQLEKVTRYFEKVKKELEVVEGSKDEDFKRFANHKIKFDFSIIGRIKEAMVGLSSRCLHLAMEESKRARAPPTIDRVRSTTYDANRQRQCSQMLWRAFQLAYRVYNFAGGHDDLSERLISDMASEIESYPAEVWS